MAVCRRHFRAVLTNRSEDGANDGEEAAAATIGNHLVTGAMGGLVEHHLNILALVLKLLVELLELGNSPAGLVFGPSMVMVVVVI